MSGLIDLQAKDGHRLQAYLADPGDSPVGGVVIVQEIFGVTRHIRDVCDQYAAEGYLAIAPALFDRIETGIDLSYDAAGVQRGRELKTTLGWDSPILDIEAAANSLQRVDGFGVVGYCWGGTLAFLSAVKLEPAVAVGYYGAQIIDFKDEPLRCPVMLHFGEQDAGIPLADVQKIGESKPDIPIHTYPAGHGFNCTERADFHPDSAALAKERTLYFLSQHMG